MSSLIRSAGVLVIHLAIVLAVVAKARYDWETLPHVWVKTAPVDPDHPLRGRYVRLGLLIEPCRTLPAGSASVQLLVRDDKLCAEPTIQEGGPTAFSNANGTRLAGTVSYYIPEHAPDPSHRPPSEELWAEVAVSAHGMPRPIRLGIKKADVITPLEFR